MQIAPPPWKVTFSMAMYRELINDLINAKDCLEACAALIGRLSKAFVARVYARAYIGTKGICAGLDSNSCDA
jgi:hypothetical protein